MSLLVSIKKDLGTFKLRSEFEMDGELLGFLGASGCGKSMTLKCIAGIETPDEGKIVLNGITLFDKEKGINLPPQKRKVGYLFQNYALFPNMTVEQNIMCGLNWTKDKDEKARLASEMIEKMYLTGLEKHKPHQLSGGQQQRTALARILVNRPEILLLDEPFSALDSYLRSQLQTEMKNLMKDYGKDVILVSHSRDEVYRLCDNLAIMSDGRILGKGKTKEIFRNPRTLQGAILTGCKNNVEAVKAGEYKVFVPEWGVELETREPVGDNLKAIGIRAHYFNSRIDLNRHKVVLVEEMEEPFEYTLKFRYANSRPNSEPIWWRMTKEKKPSKFPETLGISPQNIMLLY